MRPLEGASYEEEALEVSCLDRERLRREGPDPADAMREAYDFVQGIAKRSVDGEDRAVFAAWPLGFDWMWMHWYFVRFVGGSPFGFGRALDMKTLAAIRLRRPIAATGLRDLPIDLRADTPHTHNALDDAQAQAQILRKLLGGLVAFVIGVGGLAGAVGCRPAEGASEVPRACQERGDVRDCDWLARRE